MLKKLLLSVVVLLLLVGCKTSFLDADKVRVFLHDERSHAVINYNDRFMIQLGRQLSSDFAWELTGEVPEGIELSELVEYEYPPEMLMERPGNQVGYVQLEGQVKKAGEYLFYLAYKEVGTDETLVYYQVSVSAKTKNQLMIHLDEIPQYND